jgi:saposin
MKTVILLIAVFTTGCLAEIDPKCAWGESYWCSSLRNAKTCGAFDHCRTTIWENEMLKKDESEVCQFCEAIVGDVRKFIEDKRTQDDISTFISSACNIIPDKTIADECKYAVQFLMTELLQLASSELDPQMICSLMRICSGLEDTVKHSPIVPPPSDNGLSHRVPLIAAKKLSPLVGINSEPICTDCKKFFTDIKNLIGSNQTEAEVEDLIDNAVCSLLGSFESECKALVHEFLPEIMDMLTGYYDPGLICQSLGVCNQDLVEAKNLLLFFRLRKLPLYQAAGQQNSAESCLLCKTVMEELQMLDRDTAFQAKVTTMIKTQLCNHLGSMKDTCNQAVDTYGPELFQLLATELDPNTRCRSLGFCAVAEATVGKSEPTVGKTQPMVDLSPAKPASHLTISASPECILCEYVVNELKSLIGDNATEAQVMAALEKVCSILPKAVQDSCRSFIEVYGPAIIELLLQELDAEQVCTQLGLCDGTKLPIPPPKPTALPVGDTETCAVCETVVQYLEALMEQNATEVEIEMILERICAYLPDPMATTCNNLVKEYGDLIIHYLTTFASPKEVCTLIGVCGSKKGRQDLVGGQEEMEVTKKAPVVGQNECTWGPAYWCASRENADKCNAVDHCKRKVWK